MNRLFARPIRAALAAAGLLAASLVATAPATAQTVEEIKAKGELLVGVVVDFPPFGVMDVQTNTPIGYEPEVAKLMADRLGIPLKMVPVTGPNRIPYLLTGQIDLVIGSLAMTPARAEQVQFSNPYSAIEVVLYALDELEIDGPEDLVGVSVAVVRGNTQDVSLTAQAPEGTIIQRFDDDSSAVQALLSGQVQAIGAGTLVVAELGKTTAPGTYGTKFTLHRQVQGIAMRPGQDELKGWVNTFLADVIASGELGALYQKWVGVDLPVMEMPDLTAK